MENLVLEVINNPVIVYPGAQLSSDEETGSLVEGFIQFDLSHSYDVDLKIRLMGMERHNKMLHQDKSTGEVKLLQVGQRIPLFHIEANLVYMFVGGRVPCTPTLPLQPGNHIFAFSGRIPHSTPSSEANSYVTTSYEAVAIAHGKRSTGWPKLSVDKSATHRFEVRVQPSIAGPNEVNKLDARMQPADRSITDIPFKAFARSINARLGGCMELQLVIAGPVSAEIRFDTISLVLEQYCTMNSVRFGSFERLLCSQALLSQGAVTPERESLIHEATATLSEITTNGRPVIKPSTTMTKSRLSDSATITLKADFPKGGVCADHPEQEWIVSTPKKTHTNIRFSHKLKLKVGISGTAQFIDYTGETWDLETDVMLVDARLKTADVVLPEYSSVVQALPL